MIDHTKSDPSTIASIKSLAETLNSERIALKLPKINTREESERALQMLAGPNRLFEALGRKVQQIELDNLRGEFWDLHWGGTPGGLW